MIKNSVGHHYAHNEQRLSQSMFHHQHILSHGSKWDSPTLRIAQCALQRACGRSAGVKKPLHMAFSNAFYFSACCLSDEHLWIDVALFDVKRTAYLQHKSAQFVTCRPPAIRWPAGCLTILSPKQTEKIGSWLSPWRVSMCGRWAVFELVHYTFSSQDATQERKHQLCEPYVSIYPLWYHKVILIVIRMGK